MLVWSISCRESCPHRGATEYFQFGWVIQWVGCLQQMSQLFASGGQSTGASASASVLPVNIQDWFPLVWTGWISFISKRLSRVFSSTTVWKHQFFGVQPSLWSNALFIGKDSDAGKDWRQEEKRTAEDEMVGWHHWLSGHALGWTLEDSEGQGSLECCSPWVARAGHT